MARRGTIDTGEKFNPKDNPFGIGEMKTDGVEIEPVSANADLRKIAAEEAFMNEMVKIRVHEDASEGALSIITPNVNGVNQPVVRGHPVWVKRKYVESLARSISTGYRQETPDPRNPDQINMVPKTVPSYPFEVLEDKNPKGRAWLEAILHQAL
jgi:hypothetical protein